MASRRIVGPLTKVPNQICLRSIGRPFSVDSVSIWQNIETQFFVTFTKLFKAAFSIIDGLDPLLSVTESASQSIFERRKPRVKLDNACKC